jgi:hypothetical protein
VERQDNNTGISETILNKLVERGLESQLEQADQLQVRVNAEPLQFAMGKVDSVSLAGTNLALNSDLRISEIEVQINQLAVDLFGIVFGKLELTQSADVSAQMMLTAADLNRAVRSDSIRDRLKNLSLQVDDEVLVLDVQDIRFELPGEGRLGLDLELLAKRQEERQTVNFYLVLRFEQGGEVVRLEQAKYTSKEALTFRETASFADLASRLLQKRTIQLAEATIEIQRIELAEQQFNLQIQANVAQLPQLLNET